MRMDIWINYHSISFLFFFFLGYTSLCKRGQGSDFLTKFLETLEDNITKDWDILAQITEASKQVINMGNVGDKTQTVNFTSLLPSQLKLG
jgi:hypothetical protein